MAVTEIPTTERQSPASERPWRGRAFGLVLESSEPFPGVQPAPGAHAGRVTAWREESADAIKNTWKLEDGDVLLDRRHSDGRLFLRVDSHDTFGFRVWAPYYGRHLVSADGSAIASALPCVPPARWQRLFFAQVLPLSSALSGLCLFHGSAIALAGHVVAFVGPSGSGTTSVTAQLVALGASFVTDDVLAIETADAGVVAHPGPARLSIDKAELGRIPSTQQLRLGPCVARSDKLVREPTPVPCSLPLARLYFLRPAADNTRIAIVEREAPSSQPLLASRYLSYLRSSGLLQRHVDTCAAVDESVRLYDVQLPTTCRARDVAARVLAHCEKLVGALRL
jgi:hypothetical protein